MKTEGIGGYFELELPDNGGFPHDDGVLLNSGRNALEYVFRVLGDVKQVLIPYYTCDVVLEPIQKLNISYTFYRINRDLELEWLPSLQDCEYLLYTNYFGIKDEYVRKLAEHYSSRLIVDNAQAWFAEPIEGISTIYSPRKFVGLPDGGVAYCSRHMDEDSFEQDISFARCSHLLKRIDLGPSDGYVDFRENSKQLVGQPIKQMSELTKRLLCSIDFKEARYKRKENFRFLHKNLQTSNLFNIPAMDSFACPMIYPYLTNDIFLRQKLIENKIFIATYWPNVQEWATKDLLERNFMDKLLPIPCDQRYGTDEMKTIITII